MIENDYGILAASLANSVHQVIAESDDDQLLMVQIVRSNLDLIIKVLEQEARAVKALTNAEKNEDMCELGHWIAAPMIETDCRKFHDVVKRAERVIDLLREREKALRINLDIAADTIKKLEGKRNGATLQRCKKGKPDQTRCHV